MKKVYFLDIGLRNLINQSLSFSALGNEAGIVFENYVYLELKRMTDNIGTIQYYRTLDGSEVDFIVQYNSKLYAIEVKSKDLKKPMYMKNINSIESFIDVSKSFIVNKSFNYEKDNKHYIPAYLMPRIIL